MTTDLLGDIARLDPDAVGALFDPGGEFRLAASGGQYTGDFHRDLRRARETGPVHPGTVEDVLGIPHHASTGSRPPERPTPSRSSSDYPHPDVEERSTMIRTRRSNSMAQWIRS